jgi:hypothetical protein
MNQLPKLPGDAAGAVIGPAPIHPLSALVTVLLDWLWLAIEVPETMSVALLPGILLTSIVLGVICLVAVTLVQRFLARDDWGTSLAKGFVMGIVAGVPYPVVGTAVGVPLLAWAGVRGVQKALPAGRGD